MFTVGLPYVDTSAIFVNRGIYSPKMGCIYLTLEQMSWVGWLIGLLTLSSRTSFKDNAVNTGVSIVVAGIVSNIGKPSTSNFLG